MRNVLLTLLLAGVSFSQPALVAHTAKAGTANGVTTNAINTSGATLLVVSTTQFSGFGTLSDSKGNTWTKLTTQSISSSVSAIYYAANPTVGSGHTFTIAGSSIYPGIAVAGFSGVKMTSPFDVQSGNTVGGTSIQTGSVTPSQNNELIVTALGDTSGISTATININSSFQIIDKVTYAGGVNYGQSLAYFVQGTAVAVNPTWSWSGTNNVAASIATFKAAPPVTSIRHRVVSQ